MEKDNHCADCCCAQSWKALGITQYTGKSIPEHITMMKSDLAALTSAFAHYHKNNGVDDTCAECGFDLRNPIHLRA